jgi:nucleoside-diphosphate-sugar epimerase
LATCLVSGAAGFVGSALARQLLADGHDVAGIDCFTDFYPREIKERNLDGLLGADRFVLHEEDLLHAELASLMRGIEFVFHEAGQAGVRGSWGQNFSTYADANIVVTQRLLEAAAKLNLTRFVFASSSSIYGSALELPTTEGALPRPVSPYGVTKLAAEHLCGLYASNFEVPTISLRYFTVYGPGQRPDMAFNKFVRSILAGEEVVVHGDGEQTRDFTYVADIVRATMAAAFDSAAIGAGSVYNVGGGVRTTVNRVVGVLGGILNSTPRVKHMEAQAGDARDTYADCSAAARDLGYSPSWTLESGLSEEAEWIRRELAR